MQELVKNRLIFGFAVFSTFATLNFLFKKFCKARNGKLKVDKLIIYPIKSLKGVELDQLEVVDSGVKHGIIHDRSFVILNEKKLLITLRNKPKICLIKLSIHANEIWLDAPGMDTLKIVYDADVSSNKFFEFDVWGTTAKGHEYSEEASEWLSKYIDCKVHLIKFSDGVHDRITNSKTEKVTNPVVYQDGFPAFLTNQTSIDDLNSRLSRQDRVTYRSFRPNIHIVNGEPYEEDNWFNFKINGLQFKHIHPCARCTTTLVNPDNGVKNENFEPLKTLRTYRILDEYKHLFDKAPLFGINLVSLNSGIIKINDELKILDHKH